MRQAFLSCASCVLILNVASCGRDSAPASSATGNHSGSGGVGGGGLSTSAGGRSGNILTTAFSGSPWNTGADANAGATQRTDETSSAGAGTIGTNTGGLAGVAGANAGIAGAPGVPSVPWLTPCRDLSADAALVSAASTSQHFLVANTLGASLVTADDQQVLRTFTGQFGAIEGIGLSPDATFAASIGTDKALRIWRTSDGKQTAAITLTALPTRLALSQVATKPLIAVADESKLVTVIDATSGVERWRLLRDFAPTGLAFSPDADQLLILSASMGEWCSADTGVCSSGFSVSSPGASALSVDGTLLAVADASGSKVNLVRASDGASSGTINVGSHVNVLSFSRDASTILVAAANGAYGFDVATTQRLRTFGDRTHATGVALSADGQTVAVSSGHVEYYRFSDAARLATFGQTGVVWEGSFAADGRYQFSGAGGPVQVWDPMRGVRLLAVERPSNGNQGKVLFAPNGFLLINHEATATYWDVAQGAQTLSINYQTTSVRPALHQEVFSKDGKVLISEGTLPNLGHLQFWDASNGQLLRTVSAYGYAVGRLAISPNGELLATSGAERGSDSTGAKPGSQYLKLWNVATGELVHQFAEATDAIKDIRFSPDGKLLLTGQRDGLVRLWSIPEGKAVRDLATGWQHIEGAMSNFTGNSVAFSPDGTLAASAGVDWTVTESHTGSISLWSIPDGSLKARLLSLTEGNLGLIEWSPDGKLFAAGTNAGVRVWCLDELASAPTVMPPPSRVAQP